MKTDLQKDINNYIRGRISFDERLAFEERLKSDPFLADAVEGFKLFPEMAWQPINRTVVWKKIALVIIVLALGFTWIYVWQESTNEESLSRVVKNKSRVLSAPSIRKIQNDAIKISAMPPVQAAEIDIHLSKANLALPKKHRIYLQMAEPIYLGLVEPKISARFPEYRYRAIYIHSLKVVLVDTANTVEEPKLPKHVPARYESELKYQQSQSLYRPRENNVHYMEKALTYFEKGEFQKSLGELNRTSIRLPNDLNIIFYQGLCLYHLEAYEPALKHFKRTQTLMEPGFNEEAKWYEGLCLEKTGNIERALEIYREVLDQNGFYSMRAAKRIVFLQSE